MHTFHHKPTGVRIHYNSDYSGNAVIWTNPHTAFEVPAAALEAFGFNAGVNAAVDAVEGLYQG